MKITKETILRRIKRLIYCVTNPRFLLCFGIAWMITNGWAYVLLGFGAYLDIEWMTAVSGIYLAFLWLPFTPEKLITVPISIALLRLLFPKDEKTLGLLREMGRRAKKEIKKRREKKKDE